MKIEVNELAILASGISNFDFYERSIIMFLSQKIKDNKFGSLYKISYKQLFSLFGDIAEEKKELQLRKTIISLSQKTFTAHKPTLDMYRYWFIAINNDKFNQYVTFKISDDLKPYYLLMNKINLDNIKDIDLLKTKTAKIIYIYLYINKDKDNIFITINEAKNIFYTGLFDLKINDLFRKHIDKAVNEINKYSSMKVKYEKIKDLNDSRKYNKIKFLLE